MAKTKTKPKAEAFIVICEPPRRHKNYATLHGKHVVVDDAGLWLNKPGSKDSCVRFCERKGLVYEDRTSPSNAKSPRMDSDEIMAVVTLVPHGYQLEFFRRGKPAKSLGSSCRDFGGEHAPKQMVTTVMAGIAVLMERAEFFHGRAERWAKLSEEKAEALTQRCRLIRRAIMSVLAVASAPMKDTEIAKAIRFARTCIDVAGEADAKNFEVKEELELLRIYNIVELTAKGYSL